VNITASIGPDTDERSVSVTIEDDNGWSPDQMTDACNRVITAAVVAWRELHPTPSLPPVPAPIDRDTADQILVAVRQRLRETGRTLD
jgi:hypothetical protein